MSQAQTSHLQNVLVQEYNNAVELHSLPQSSLQLFTSVSACASAQSSRPPGYHQGFLAAVLAFPLGPVLIWVISTSVRASGGRHERMRSMVLW